MKNKNPNEVQFLISHLTVRKAIGLLGICLPAILLLGNIIIGNCNDLQESISHYYFTMMRDVLVGVLVAVAIFLILYRGYEDDNIYTNLAGVFALLVALFPTSMSLNQACVVCAFKDSNVRELVHYISASLFFITLAYISYFLFTKTDGDITKMKLVRNKLYKSCGIIIVLSIFIILCYHKCPWIKHLFGSFQPVFWIEWVALIAFGISWIVKGELFLTDKN